MTCSTCCCCFCLTQLHAEQWCGDGDAHSDGEGSLYCCSQRLLVGHVAGSKREADIVLGESEMVWDRHGCPWSGGLVQYDVATPVDVLVSVLNYSI